MGMKRYVFFTIVLIVLFAIYAIYEFQDVTHSLVFFGVTVTLPIAVWVLLPMVVLAFFSIVHLFVYGMKIYMSNRALVRDYETFIASSKSALLGDEYNAKFKTEWFKLPNEMLKAMRFPKVGVNSLDDDGLKNICQDISSVQDGEFVNLKTYKLKDDNPLVIQNKMNQLSNDPKVASDILKGCSNKDSELCKQAFDVLVENASYTEIKRYNISLSPEQVITILKRSVDKEDDLFINDVEVDNLINSVEMNADQYLEVAKVLKNELNPEMLVTMFENIYHKNSISGKAYLYTLFELQMIDKAREVLSNIEEGEHEAFKTYLFLRDNGKNTDIKHFV